MEKELVVDQVTVRGDGVLEIRFQKRVVDDDGTILSYTYHRTTCEPFVPHENQLSAVDRALSQPENGSWPPISQAGRDFVGRLAANEHTPERAQARREYLQDLVANLNPPAPTKGETLWRRVGNTFRKRK